MHLNVARAIAISATSSHIRSYLKREIWISILWRLASFLYFLFIQGFYNLFQLSLERLWEGCLLLEVFSLANWSKHRCKLSDRIVLRDCMSVSVAFISKFIVTERIAELHSIEWVVVHVGSIFTTYAWRHICGMQAFSSQQLQSSLNLSLFLSPSCFINIWLLLISTSMLLFLCSYVP